MLREEEQGGARRSKEAYDQMMFDIAKSKKEGQARRSRQYRARLAEKAGRQPGKSGNASRALEFEPLPAWAPDAVAEPASAPAGGAEATSLELLALPLEILLAIMTFVGISATIWSRVSSGCKRGTFPLPLQPLWSVGRRWPGREEHREQFAAVWWAQIQRRLLQLEERRREGEARRACVGKLYFGAPYEDRKKNGIPPREGTDEVFGMVHGLGLQSFLPPLTHPHKIWHPGVG